MVSPELRSWYEDSMKLSIMENASDSLRRVTQYYTEGTVSGLKAAVKELISCIELFTKEKIRRLDLDTANPVLLFKNLKISVNDTRTGYLISPLSKEKTVTFNEAVERLDWLGNPISKNDQNIIRKLKKIRNALEHLEVNEDPNEVKLIFASTLGFTIRFVEKYLSTSRETIVDSSSWKTLLSRNEIYQQIEKSYQELCNDVLSSEKWLTGSATCVHCGSDLVVESSGYYSGVLCKICGHTQHFEMCYSCKKDFPLDELNDADGDTMLCNECNQRI